MHLARGGRAAGGHLGEESGIRLKADSRTCGRAKMGSPRPDCGRLVRRAGGERQEAKG